MKLEENTLTYLFRKRTAFPNDTANLRTRACRDALAPTLRSQLHLLVLGCGFDLATDEAIKYVVFNRFNKSGEAWCNGENVRL